LLEFVGVSLPWNIFNKYKSKNENEEELKKELTNLKEMCMNEPETYLFNYTTHKKELAEILNHLNELKYEDKPNYNLIR